MFADIGVAKVLLEDRVRVKNAIPLWTPGFLEGPPPRLASTSIAVKRPPRGPVIGYAHGVKGASLEHSCHILPFQPIL